MVPAVGRQSGGDEGRLPFPQGTSCHSRPASRSRLLDLLHQAIAPAVLTSCCDFPLQDLPETVLRRGRHHTQHKRAAHSLLPAYIRAALCCYVARSHLFPPHPPSPTLLTLLSSLQATKQVFLITLTLLISSLDQLFFTASHSPSCRLTFYPSHSPAPFVRAGGERCRLSCGASRSSSLLPKKCRAGINTVLCLPQTILRALTAQ